MLKRFMSIVSLSILVSAVFMIQSSAMFAQDLQGPIVPQIVSFNPAGFYPGVVMAVEGGPFIPQDEHTGSVVFFDGDEMDTFFESSSRLVFVVPLWASCAPNHYAYVRTISGPHETPVIVESERVDIIVQCTEDRPYGPRPRIKEVRHSEHVTAGKEPIYVRGFDIMPFNPRDGYPHTLVHYTMDNIVGTEELTYHRFGEASFVLNVDRCGTYNVTLRNYYMNSRHWVNSSDYDIDVTNGCDDVPAIEGSYDLSISNIPESAQIGEPYQLVLDIEFTGAFDVTAELQISLNGKQLDSRQITIGAHDTTQFPLNLTFSQSGVNTLEVTLGDRSTTAEIVVESPGDPAQPVPALVVGDRLSDYDADGDCYIGQLEYNVLTDAWIAGQISEELFFLAMDAWIDQTNICTNGSGTRELHVLQRNDSVIFSASSGFKSLRVTIFDTSGHLIDSQISSASRLAWRMRNLDGARVANGVYIVKIVQERANGSKIYGLKKLVVMR